MWKFTLKRDVTIQNVHFFDLARVCLVIKFYKNAVMAFDLISSLSWLHKSGKKTNVGALTILY